MALSRALTVTLLVSSACVATAIVVACSSDETPGGGGSPDASTTADTGGGGGGDGGGGGGGDDSGSGGDSGRDGGGGDASCNGTANAPVLDGGGACGTLPFGLAAAMFGPVDVDAGNSYDGGALPPGIYDAFIAERASGAGGSWRETFVVDGAGNFTRIRQIQATAGGALGPVTYRAGTYALNGGSIQLNYTCAYSETDPVDAGPDNLPYDVVSDGCGAPRYRYGASGIRITLRRRTTP
ncbi:MAG: hypothetical protein JNL38_19180 [Myxococcales bacterium]|nr:hypothetical protein [Myxococcales bacterium]